MAGAGLFELVEILESHLRDVGERLAGEEGLVACDEDVGEGGEAKEAVVFHDGFGVVFEEDAFFLFVDVEAERADGAVLYPANGGVGVDEASPARVDDHDSLLEFLEAVVVDEVVGLRGEGAVEANDVGLGEQFFERKVFGAELDQFLVRVWVVGEQLTAKAFHDAAEDAADFSSTDDADGFAVEVEPLQTVDGVVKLANPVVGAVDLAVQAEDEAGGELGDGVGRVGGHSCYGDAEPLGRFEVDVVESGAAECYHAAVVVG